MSSYTPTIGLEIHAELKTKTKLFCNSKNDPDETHPNINICPVCMGYPGTLPVINKRAIEHVVRVGIAVGGEIADVTYFDRKNYFYPDIPKGYQISQYKYPVVSGGELAGVKITRVHLEEDTARSQHQGDASLVDFNRAGIPLMELVTEPVIRDAVKAGRFARELQLLLQYLNASEANLEKGEMRIEANISISKDEQKGTKVEVKNLNSFRSVERAIAYEIQRQTSILERGEQVVQETRGFDEAKQETFSQRLKEESQDYRYFPEPDLTIFKLSELLDVATLRASLPELPAEKRDRYIKEYELTKEAAEIFIRSSDKDNLFVTATKGILDKKLNQSIAHYIASEIPALLGEEGVHVGNITPKALADIARMKQAGDISSRGVKDILVVLLKKGGEPARIAAEEGLLQTHDVGELQKVVEQILKDHAEVAADYRAGKDAALQFLIGQGMKATKGSANPETLKKILTEKLQ